MLRQVKPKTLKESVADRLRRDIVNGVLPPGTIIRDLELAERYEASTSPVREAVTLLTAEGLIEMPSNRPKQVAHIDRQSARELVAVFRLLIIAAYEWGAPRVDADGVREMREALKVIKRTARGGDTQAFATAARAYEDVIIRASGNRALRRQMIQLYSTIERIVVLWRMQGLVQPRVMEEIVQALEAGDPKAAVAHCRELVDQFQRDVDALAPFL
jgi:DNA-binding GntR family transcriptional regulator